MDNATNSIVGRECSPLFRSVLTTRCRCVLTPRPLPPEPVDGGVANSASELDSTTFESNYGADTQTGPPATAPAA